MMKNTFPCYLVRDSDDGVSGGVTEASLADLPPGDLLIEVAYSSLNYKDALACRGHPGVAPRLPHVPGIDCSGTVIASESSRYRVGDSVIVTGYDFGSKQWGGYAGVARAPSEWAVPLPSGMSPRDAMVLGTAGFTAAQCVMAVAERVSPADGEVVVSGATGGVGSLSVALLAKLGYRVVAVTGKPEREAGLLSLGAEQVVGREALEAPEDRPMLKASWAAAIDTVGGKPLECLIRSTHYRGVVAACGLVAGDQLELSVYPFLLRGVTLAGIDSAQCPYEMRREVWRRLAGPWKVLFPESGSWVQEHPLSDLPDCCDRIMRGEIAGRTLIRPVA